MKAIHGGVGVVEVFCFCLFICLLPFFLWLALYIGIVVIWDIILGITKCLQRAYSWYKITHKNVLQVSFLLYQF